MPREIVDMPVTIEKQTVNGVILRYTKPCHFCGGKHTHGNETAIPDADRTYGLRVPHCPSHDSTGRLLGNPNFIVRLIPANGEG